MATFPPAALSVSGAAGERRRLGAFDSRTSCQSGRGLGTGPFFPRENGSPSAKHGPGTRQRSGSLVVGRRGASAATSLGPHSPAAGSARSTRPAPLHGSASRSAVTTPTQHRGWGAGRPRRPPRGPPVARAQRAPRAHSASLPAGDAQGPPPPLLLLLPPRAGCGRERRRGPAARRPSHAAMLTRAASPRAPAADFRNQKAISSSPGKGTMRRRGREPRGANA